MRLTLLNPPRRRGRRRNSKRWYTKGCRTQRRRHAAWKSFHHRRGPRAPARSSADPFGYAALLSRNPLRRRRNRRGRRRNDAGSAWLPAYTRYEDLEVQENRGRRHRGRRRNAAFRYGTAYLRRNSGSDTWLPAFRNPYWVPRYAMNPGVVGSLTSGFKPKLIVAMTPYVGGALANAILASQIKKLGFLPSMLKSGIGGTVTNLASAGLLGAGVGMIAPKYAGAVFMGGVVDAVINLFNESVKPLLGLKGCCGYGMSDYLTPQNAAAATSLGDYLTSSDAAAALPLGGIEDVSYDLPDLPADVAAYQSGPYV